MRSINIRKNNDLQNNEFILLNKSIKRTLKYGIGTLFLSVLSIATIIKKITTTYDSYILMDTLSFISMTLTGIIGLIFTINLSMVIYFITFKKYSVNSIYHIKNKRNMKNILILLMLPIFVILSNGYMKNIVYEKYNYSNNNYTSGYLILTSDLKTVD